MNMFSAADGAGHDDAQPRPQGPVEEEGPEAGVHAPASVFLIKPKEIVTQL